MKGGVNGQASGPQFIALPVDDDGKRATVRALRCHRWQTQLVETGAERQLGLSLHNGIASASIVLLDLDELDRLIANLRLRRGSIGKLTPH